VYKRQLLTNLRENITDDDYRKLLMDYLRNFVKMVENPQRRDNVICD